MISTRPNPSAGVRTLALIPSGASVLAQAAILPHLSERAAIYVLDRRLIDAEFVIACEGLNAWPATTAADIRELIEERKRRGDETLFAQSGWTVLRARHGNPR